jgi:hypothetical protein
MRATCCPSVGGPTPGWKCSSSASGDCVECTNPNWVPWSKTPCIPVTPWDDLLVGPHVADGFVCHTDIQGPCNPADNMTTNHNNTHHHHHPP